MPEPIGTGLRDICTMGFDECQGTGPVLEPGDILLAKTNSNPLSKLIARLDGWWSHCALVLDASNVVHSNAGGLTIEPLESLKDHYAHGIAVVRPNLAIEHRQKAAAWAAKKTDEDSCYGASDLGVAFSLLWRLRSQPSAAELERLLSNERIAAAQPSADDQQEPRYEATCSAFVYQSYLYGAEVDLKLKTAPGVRLLDGMLTAPSDEELLDELRDIMSQPAGSHSRRRAQIGFVGIWSALKALRLDEPVPVEIGVTPGDLWMSTHQARWFLQGRDRAAAAAAACVH